MVWSHIQTRKKRTTKSTCRIETEKKYTGDKTKEKMDRPGGDGSENDKYWKIEKENCRQEMERDRI